jgi:hypothetical protein
MIPARAVRPCSVATARSTSCDCRGQVDAGSHQPPQVQRLRQQADNNTKRTAQAERVAAIYQARRADGWKRIAVVGDLNDTPDSAPLEPLLVNTDLTDVSEHPAYIQDGRTGTFRTSQDKIDYLLLSPELFGAVTSGGLNRSGVWHGPNVRDPWRNA